MAVEINFPFSFTAGAGLGDETGGGVENVDDGVVYCMALSVVRKTKHFSTSSSGICCLFTGFNKLLSSDCVKMFISVGLFEKALLINFSKDSTC